MRRRKGRVPWWLILLLILNLLIRIIPQEWISGSVLTAENVRQQAEAWIADQKEPAADVLQDENRWLSLSDSEKVRTLERLAEEQAASLGLWKHIDVKVVELDDNLAGQYNDRTRTIEIDAECFEKFRPEKLAYVVCHEVRHAYQFALADAWMNLCADSRYADLELFDMMEACYEGLNNYCHASEDLETYKNQWVEIDAREYADEEITRIWLKKDE